MTDTVEPGGAGRTISRRTVAKGAAWSLPAVLIAKSTPALAASPPIIIDFGDSSACKIPGNSWGSAGYNKGYVLWGQFVNTLDTTVSFRVTNIVVGGVDQCLVGVTDPALATPCPPQTIDCITLAPGEEQIYGVFSNASSDSSSTDVAVTIEYWVNESSCGAPGSGQTGVTSGSVVGQPWTTPQGGGSCDFPFPKQSMCLTPPSATAAGPMK